MKRLYLQPHTHEDPPALVLHMKCRHCDHEEVETHRYDIRAALYDVRVLIDWIYRDKSLAENVPSKFGEVN